MTYALFWLLASIQGNRQTWRPILGSVLRFGVAPELNPLPRVNIQCFPGKKPLSAPAGRIGECVDFYKNFSKRRFYDGSSLLGREWGRFFITFILKALRPVRIIKIYIADYINCMLVIALTFL